MIFQQIRNHPDRYFWLCMGLLIILSVVRVFMTINRSLTIDEPFSANVVILPWTEMFRMFLRDPSAPLYYVFLKLWVSVFGESEQALRSLSVIFFAGTILIVGITAKQLNGIFPAIAGALLASISSTGLNFAGTARPYALLSLLTAISTLIFFSLLGLTRTNILTTNRKFFLLTVFVIMNILALLTHPIFIFFMIGYSVAAWVKNRQQFWIVSLCNVITVGIYLLVWGTFFVHTVVLPATTWLEVPDIKDLIHGYLNLWGIAGTTLLFLYIVLSTVWNLRSTQDFVVSHPGLMSLTVLTATSLLPFLISQYKPIFDDSRTPALFFPLACVFVALLLTRFKNLKLAFGILILIFSFVLTNPIFASSNSAIEHSPRSSIKYAVENAKCGDVFISGGMSISETTYYMNRFNASDCIQRKAFPESINDHPGWMDPFSLLQHSDQLTREADALANNLDQTLGRQNHVWFFYETRTPRQKVLDILKSNLDATMNLVQTVPGYGTFFESILVYSSKQ
jgi:hypothetical protein